MLDIIQSLWTDPIDDMQMLCMKSFLHHGHQFFLYTYDIEAMKPRVPEGVVLLDANSILPPKPAHWHHANHADCFRYEMLYQRGGWWVDMDVVCLRPFDLWLDHEFVFSMQDEQTIVNNAIIRAPALHPMMKETAEKAREMMKVGVTWEDLSFHLLHGMIGKHHQEQYRMPPRVFCPVKWWDVAQLVDPCQPDVSQSWGLHLWHSRWARSNLDVNGNYPGSLYTKLRQQYGAWRY